MSKIPCNSAMGHIFLWFGLNINILNRCISSLYIFHCWWNTRYKYMILSFYIQFSKKISFNVQILEPVNKRKIKATKMVGLEQSALGYWNSFFFKQMLSRRNSMWDIFKFKLSTTWGTQNSFTTGRCKIKNSARDPKKRLWSRVSWLSIAWVYTMFICVVLPIICTLFSIHKL